MTLYDANDISNIINGDWERWLIAFATFPSSILKPCCIFWCLVLYFAFFSGVCNEIVGAVLDVLRYLGLCSICSGGVWY